MKNFSLTKEDFNKINLSQFIVKDELKEKKFKMAMSDIKNYIEVYEKADTLYTGKLRLERAVQLVVLFRRGQIREGVIKKVEEEILNHREDKESFTVYHLIKLLLKLKR